MALVFFSFFKQSYFCCRHYIALITYATSEADHLEWSGMVESKIRHLIGSLERNQHIRLAHIWPNSFAPVNKDEEHPYVTQWFIGLVFAKCGNLNVDLTYDIHTFTDNGNC